MSIDIFRKVEDIKNEIQSNSVQNKEALEQFRIQFLGSKNKIKAKQGK